MLVCYNVQVKLYIRGTIMCELENVIETAEITNTENVEDHVEVASIENEELADVDKTDDTENVDKLSENANFISRYKKREQAFILSFESLFSDTEIDELADNAVDSNDEFMSDYAIFCAKGILANAEEIDGYISENLKKGWRINRISKVSYTVLRLAIFEMLYVEDIPVSVSMNEAVELAKKYSVPDDSAFVNGVLGSIAKKLDKDE